MKNKKKPYIYDIPRAELLAELSTYGLPAYRFKQLCTWLDKGVEEAEEMSNLPKELRSTLAERYAFCSLECIEEYQSELDETKKFVFRLHDGNIVECVYMEYRYGRSVCISSQAGCRMGCRFCASTKAGFARNLSAGEMLAQLRLVARRSGKRISHVVVMGVGEPFENYDNLMMFLQEAHKPETFNISYRNMTVSTCGLIPEMLKFTDEHIPVTLAVSLHAADDQTRQELMPIAKRYTLDELLAACRYYIKHSGRRISFEYALFSGVNDSVADAQKLVRLLKSMLCHVNLIPANPFPGSRFACSSMQSIKQFKQVLDEAHIPCSIRRALGRDIMAACGQLRRRLEE